MLNTIMKYPHWFCYMKDGGELAGRPTVTPIAVMLISEGQALCAAEKYAALNSYEFKGTFTLFNSLDELLSETGLSKSRLTILSDDERGKCIAFKYCDEPGGRCDVDYYDCGCFI